MSLFLMHQSTIDCAGGGAGLADKFHSLSMLKMDEHVKCIQHLAQWLGFWIRCLCNIPSQFKQWPWFFCIPNKRWAGEDFWSKCFVPFRIHAVKLVPCSAPRTYIPHTFPPTLKPGPARWPGGTENGWQLQDSFWPGVLHSKTYFERFAVTIGRQHTISIIFGSW